jgi:hypothetical protein
VAGWCGQTGGIDVESESMQTTRPQRIPDGIRPQRIGVADRRNDQVADGSSCHESIDRDGMKKTIDSQRPIAESATPAVSSKCAGSSQMIGDFASSKSALVNITVVHVVRRSFSADTD